MKTDRSTWSIITVILAMFFGTMEMTVIITALPTLGRAFPQAENWLPWLTTATLVAAAIAMPIGGKMADNWGVKKAFLLGLAFFSLGSLFGGLVGLVGKFIPKTGYRLMIMGGMLITAGSLLAMFWGPTSLVALSIILVFSRAGGTMASIPLAAIGLEVNVRLAGIISGLRQLSNVLGGVVGPVVLSAIFPLSRPEGGRLEYVFVLMGLLVLFTLPAAHGIPNWESEVSIISQTPSSGEHK